MSVMSVVAPGCPRAYVAAPVSPANGLFRVITWAFEQAEDLTWGDLRILVSEAALGEELGHLQRLKTRGVRIGTTEQAARARAFHGVVIAYCPNQAMLTAAEALPGVRAVAAVALRNEALLEWVAAGAPQHLGGEVLTVSSGASGPPAPSPWPSAESLQPHP
ncbi:hypothetical protein [Kocuria sp. U4B]